MGDLDTNKIDEAEENMLLSLTSPSGHSTQDFYENWCDRLRTEKEAATEPINDLSIRHGLTGNVYCTSKSKKILEKVCEKINKSKNSIYFNNKHKIYAIRIKSKKHKKAIKMADFDI